MTGHAGRPAFPARRIARRPLPLPPLRAGRCKSEVAFAPSDLRNNDLRLAACGMKRTCRTCLTISVHRGQTGGSGHSQNDANDQNRLTDVCESFGATALLLQ